MIQLDKKSNYHRRVSLQNKKYQIFVSSTYEDLKNERKSILETISTMGHLPVGMELFVASDEEQFEYIKRVIDNCDYYVLILGGRYGSISSITQKSYTEMEYEYACSKGIPVLVFPYNDVEHLPIDKRDSDLTNILGFIKRATDGRMCKFWKTKDELALNVINSLHKSFEERPQRGWIRPDEFDNSELLSEINSLRKENDTLKTKIKEIEQAQKIAIENIADMDELFEIHFEYLYGTSYSPGSLKVTWNQIFSYIAPNMINALNADSLKYQIDNHFINKMIKKSYSSIYLDNDDANTIKIQFLSYGLIKIYSAKMVKGGIGEFIQLTPKGLKYLQKLKTVKTLK